MKKKVALYIRVSTSKQELENQLRQLKEYVEKTEDYELYEVYSDIISGKETSRPAYDKLFDDARKKRFDGVIFWSLDRFSRGGTLFTLQRLRELDNLGIFWHSYQEPFLSTVGPWKDVVISILATLAKLERERISERTKAGLERAKAKGKKLGRRPIPQEVVNRVVELLKQPNPPSYKKISEMVTYKGKYGKIRHISPAQITQIKKKYLEKGSQ